MRNKGISILAVTLAAALSLCACTRNTGVATLPSEESAMESEATQATIDLSGESVETIYGSQLPGYLNHQYYFEGNPVSLTESNFYFIDTFSEMTQYAGYYYPATYEGYVDLSAEISSYDTSVSSEYETYGDFFVSYSEQMLESALIINKLAADEGMTLPLETVNQIDSIIDNVNATGAVPAGITLDEYLSIYYGEGTTVESFRQTIMNYYLSDQYTSEYVENYDFDDSEIMVPNIRYALFQASSSADESVREQAETAAGALLEAADGDIDNFEVEGALSYTRGEATEYGEIPVPDDGTIDAAFTAWAWDSSRQEGDIDVIYSDNFGYFVVGYTGLTEVDEASKTQIAVAALSHQVNDWIEEGTYEFYTDEPYERALPVDIPGDALSAEDIIPGLSQDEETVSSEQEDSGVGTLTGSRALDVVFIIFAVIGGVAVIGLAAVGVKHLAGNGRRSADDKSGSKEKKEADAVEKEEQPDGDN